MPADQARQLLDDTWAWSLLRALARRARAGQAIRERTGVACDLSGRLEEVAFERAEIVLDPNGDPGFVPAQQLTPSVRQLFELYLPLCIGEGSEHLVLGHVGQSLDGQIATLAGASR